MDSVEVHRALVSLSVFFSAWGYLGIFHVCNTRHYVHNATVGNFLVAVTICSLGREETVAVVELHILSPRGISDAQAKINVAVHAHLPKAN
jgi:hypothetical protein